MTPAGEAMLRAAVRALAASRSAEARALAGVVGAVLVAEGLAAETDSPVAAVSLGAERQRRYRERHSLRNGDASRDGVTQGGVGGGLSSDLGNNGDHTKSDQGGVGGGVTRNGDASRDVTGGRLPDNASGDGAMGFAVSAWIDGFRIATGAPSSPMAHGAARVLAGALRTHTPAGVDAGTWARDAAKDYVEGNRGRTLSPFGFADWLASGRPVRAPSPVQDARGGPGRPPEPPEAVDARQRARDHEYARLKRDAVPPPTSLAALIANIPGPALRKSPPPLPAIRNELTEDEIEVRRQEQLHAAEEFESVSAKGDGSP